MRCFECLQAIEADPDKPETMPLTVGWGKEIHTGCKEAYRQRLQAIKDTLNAEYRRSEVF
jgi:hypothetical protein